MRVYTHILHNVGKLVGQNKLKQWQLRAREIFPRTILGTRAFGSPTMVNSSFSQPVPAESFGSVRCDEGFHRGGREINFLAHSQTTSTLTRTQLVPYLIEGRASQLWICGENV
jgi:hypothetical protein